MLASFQSNRTRLLLIACAGILAVDHFFQAFNHTLADKYLSREADKLGFGIPRSLESNDVTNNTPVTDSTTTKRRRIKIENDSIFVVGLPKSGTSLIRDLFQCNNRRVSNFKCHLPKESIDPRRNCLLPATETTNPLSSQFPLCGVCLERNVLDGRPPVEGCGRYQVWADFDTADLPIQKEGVAITAPLCSYPQVTHLEELHVAYPNATLILNLRSNPANWIRDMEKGRGGVDGYARKALTQCDFPGLPSGMGESDQDLIDFYNAHSERIRDFCRRYPSHKLIEVNIDNKEDTVETLADAFSMDEQSIGSCLKQRKQKTKVTTVLEPGHRRLQEEVVVVASTTTTEEQKYPFCTGVEDLFNRSYSDGEIHRASFVKVPEDFFEASVPSKFQQMQDAFEKLEKESYLSIPNAIPSRSIAGLNDITVTTHLSYKKFNRFLFLVRRWAGPVSASFYLSSPENITAFSEFVEANSEVLQNTTFHIFLEKTNKEYPHNRLRQISLDNIKSDYFLQLDVDFVTMPNCHDQMKHLLESDSQLVSALRKKTLMVLPAFNNEQLLLEDDQLRDELLPSSKSDVMDKVAAKELTEFHVESFFDGHGPTNFTKWYKYKVKSFYHIDYAMKFEPYVLGYREGLPRYWENFRGFGFNKYSWFMEAHYANYKYAVLRDFFVVHLEHQSTKQEFQRHSVRQMELFLERLTRSYGATKDEKESIMTYYWKKQDKLRKKKTKKVEARSVVTGMHGTSIGGDETDNQNKDSGEGDERPDETDNLDEKKRIRAERRKARAGRREWRLEKQRAKQLREQLGIER